MDPKALPESALPVDGGIFFSFVPGPFRRFFLPTFGPEAHYRLRTTVPPPAAAGWVMAVRGAVFFLECLRRSPVPREANRFSLSQAPSRSGQTFARVLPQLDVFFPSLGP